MDQGMFQQGFGGNFNPMMNNQNNMMDQNNMMNQNNMMMNNQNGMMMNNQNNMMMNNQNNMMMNNPNNMMMNQMMNPAMMQQNQNMMNQLRMQQQMQQNMWNPQAMMQQQQQQNAILQSMIQQQQQNNNQVNTSTNPNFITIRFKLQLRRDQNNEFSIHCTLNDKVSEVISRFRTKAQDVEDLKHEKYIFNAKRLNETLTVAEAGMSNNSVVYVINDRDLEGGNNL